MSSAINTLCRTLGKSEYFILRAASYAEAMPLVETDMDIDAILLAADPDDDKRPVAEMEILLNSISQWQHGVPLFMLSDRESAAKHISAKLMAHSTEFIWIFEDSPVFIAGRIIAAVERFRSKLLPPLMRAIWEYNEKNLEYSWAAPGHQGGRGFTKSQAGKKFYDFYGENLFRTDTGIERSSIGSLLDHTGAFGKSEKFAAKVFGADISFSGIVGTSGSNRSIMQACLTEGDLAICDRNCHKSIEQGLINTGAIPIYLKPTRNRYGIIGPILPSEMTPKAIEEKAAGIPFKITGDKRAYSVVTNCTYDGLCYNAEEVENTLSQSVDRIHFDEAWYAYARFNKIYGKHFAMRGCAKDHHGATIFATHSTHKLLTALSQASYLHMRKGRKSPDFDQLNQGYMLNASTSPLYAICSSNDVAVKMMADNGNALTTQVIEEAVDFRQALARLEREFNESGSWFFKVWNPPKVTDRKSGKVYDFADAPPELLVNDQQCWHLRPDDTWHGFKNLPDDAWVMLDPIKVSILSPGMGDDGNILPDGVPAALVSSFIYNAGIVPTRTTDFQLMFLFSIGITRGKWATLLNALLRFKELYDRDTPMDEIFPELVQAHPEKYASTGIRTLGEKMFNYLKQFRPDSKLNAAFETLPVPAMTPRQAYMELVRGNTELVPADRLAGRIAANALIPYPPGIPMVISGERFGGPDNPHMAYLKSLAAWDKQFPGFEHVTEGASVIDGIYHIACIASE
ncbi:MAG: arginine decarboxylase [Lentisphaeria bacterium]|nr:arginine decarboxylase [Lentisphaeria bacterium]